MKSSPLLLILVASAVVRVAVLIVALHAAPEALHTPDSDDYLSLADSISRGSFQRNEQAEIFRTPGYPLFLAAMNGRPLAAAGVQIALDVALVYLTYLLAGALCDGRGALVAAALAAVCPVAIVSSVRVLSDGLFAFCLAGGVLLVVRYFRSGSGWRLAAAAAVLAAGCYVRPVGVVVLAAGLVVMLAARRWRGVLIVAGVSVVCLGLWVVRNAVVADYVGFSSVGTDSLYYFAAPEVQWRRSGVAPADARRAAVFADLAAADEAAVTTPGSAARRRARSAFETIWAHPWLYARVHVFGSVGSLLPGAPGLLELLGLSQGQRGTLDVLHSAGLFAAIEHYFGPSRGAAVAGAVLSLIPLVVYIGVGVWAIARLRGPMGAGRWFAVLVVSGLLLAPGPFGMPRYRVAVMSLLHVAAGAGWVIVSGLLGRLRQRHPGAGS